jgi:predicted enzyme related to lactoylglutathione lyase
MPEVTSHPPGTFCWPELATTDRVAALAFYRGLFGWEVNDRPMGPDEVYSMLQVGGKDVAAAYAVGSDERQRATPPHWGSYIAVVSADDAATRAAELGGTVLAPPFDVMGAGRMAVLQDPSGAVFSVWEPKEHPGARLIGEPGALAWTELTSRDPVVAGNFYSALFGWTGETMEMPRIGPYTVFSVNGVLAGGMMGMMPGMEGIPSYWLPYFFAEDTDAAAAKVTSLGGKVVVPPAGLPDGSRFAVLTDPQGAMVGLFTVKSMKGE